MLEETKVRERQTASCSALGEALWDKTNNSTLDYGCGHAGASNGQLELAAAACTGTAGEIDEAGAEGRARSVAHTGSAGCWWSLVSRWRGGEVQVRRNNFYAARWLQR